MTNKQTIDGVSRELLRGLALYAESSSSTRVRVLARKAFSILDIEVDGNSHAPENKNESHVSGCCCPPKGYAGPWAAAMCPAHQGLRRMDRKP